MYLKYLKVLLRHKWFVFLGAHKLGVPLLGITHDLSKFLPDEFMPYARFFYGNYLDEKDSSIQANRMAGFNPRTKQDVARDFDRAWLKHQRRNKHHWQGWLLVSERESQQRALNIPNRYRREMLADWRSAGRLFGNPDTDEWYKCNRDNLIMHPLTREWLDIRLNYDDAKA